MKSKKYYRPAKAIALKYEIFDFEVFESEEDLKNAFPEEFNLKIKELSADEIEDPYVIPSGKMYLSDAFLRRLSSDHISRHHQLRNTIAVSWSIEDVQHHAKEMGRPKISNKNAMEILEACDRGHDATIGINWDVLTYHIDDFFEDQNKKAA